MKFPNLRNFAKARTKAGSRIRVPTSSGIDVEVEVTAVTALPEHIRTWING